MVLGFLVLAAVAGGVSAQRTGPSFTPIVTMVGCVEADGRGGFALTNATEPVALEERLPEEPEATAPLGDGRARLIGTLDEFGVANHAGHKVRVRGLYIDDDDEHRLNLTSILMLSRRPVASVLRLTYLSIAAGAPRRARDALSLSAVRPSSPSTLSLVEGSKGAASRLAAPAVALANARALARSR